MAQTLGLRDAEATTQLLGALETRDFAGLESAFVPGARARFLLPPGEEEHASAAAIRRRIESWFAPAIYYEMLACSDDPIGPRRRLMWSLRVRWNPSEEPYEVISQVAFLDVGTDGIERIDLLCSGFLPEETSNDESVVFFDAGDRGCADGLAQEFRRRLEATPAGALLVSVVRDPAARADLPPLARMLGHTVTDVTSEPGGVVRITVEKKR